MQYSVLFDAFAERHFIQSFYKKYNQQWEITRRALSFECERIDVLLGAGRAQVVSECDGIKLIKLPFKIAGVSGTTKSAANHVIAVLRERTKVVHVLCVYSKTDVPPKQELAYLTTTIKDHFKDYRQLCNY